MVVLWCCCGAVVVLWWCCGGAVAMKWCCLVGKGVVVKWCYVVVWWLTRVAVVWCCVVLYGVVYTSFIKQCYSYEGAYVRLFIVVENDSVY